MPSEPFGGTAAAVWLIWMELALLLAVSASADFFLSMRPMAFSAFAAGLLDGAALCMPLLELLLAPVILLWLAAVAGVALKGSGVAARGWWLVALLALPLGDCLEPLDLAAGVSLLFSAAGMADIARNKPLLWLPPISALVEDAGACSTAAFHQV